MASISETEDDWALEDLPAPSDDESVKKDSKQAALKLQSKVDEVQEKTDLLQSQIKLKDDFIKSLIKRLDALEAADRRQQIICEDSTQMVSFLQTEVFNLKNAIKIVGTQNEDCKSATVDLKDSVRFVENTAKRLDLESKGRFKNTTPHLAGLQRHVAGLEDGIDMRVDQTSHEVEILRADVERLEEYVKSHIDSVKITPGDQPGLGAIRRDVSCLQKPDYDTYIDDVPCSMQEMKVEAKRLQCDINERLEERADRAEILESSIRKVEQDGGVCLDSSRMLAQYQSRVDAMQAEIITLKNQNRDYKFAIDVLSDRVSDMESKSKRFDRKADHINALRIVFQSLEKDTKALNAKAEHFEWQGQADQFRTKMLLEGLCQSINDALMQTYNDFSGLERKVKVLEDSRRNDLAVYAAGVLSRKLGTGHGGFVPSYVNEFVRR